MPRPNSLKLLWFSALWLCILALTATPADSLKVLGLFPHRVKSHFIFFQPILRGLAETGHSVDVLGTYPNEQPLANYTDYVIKSYEERKDLSFDMFPRSFLRPYLTFFQLHDFGIKSCTKTLHDDAVAQILKRHPGYYDIILMEQFNTDCMMGVAHQLQAPVIALSSCALLPWHFERFGAPMIPSYMSALLMDQSQEMKFGARLVNWITVHSVNWLYKLITIPATDKLVRQRFGAHTPSVGELAKNTSLFLVNQHYSMMGPRPLPPNVIEVSGVHIQPAQPLPANLQQLLDNAEHGVVLISFGSLLHAKTLPVKKLEGLMRGVARLKQQVIFKWENETLPNKPDNLHIFDWLPQRDLLCHPNIKVFITHGGIMGCSEAVHCGVPMVGIPIYGDQFFNVASLVQRGIAVQLNYEDINEHMVYDALTSVLDRKYKAKAISIARSYNERPQTPLQLAIWWIEHVAATKGSPLTQSSAVHMSRFVYYSLDVYLVVGSAMLFVIVIFIGLKRLICGKAKRSSKPKQN